MTDSAKSTLRIKKGATFRKRFVWSTYPYPVEVRNGVVYKKDTASRAPIADRQIVDLTGCTARSDIREKIDDAAYILRLTTENGGLLLGGTAGTIDYFVSAADASAVAVKTGVWDLEVIHPNGEISSPLYGDATFPPEATRA